MRQELPRVGGLPIAASASVHPKPDAADATTQSTPPSRQTSHPANHEVAATDPPIPPGPTRDTVRSTCSQPWDSPQTDDTTLAHWLPRRSPKPQILHAQTFETTLSKACQHSQKGNHQHDRLCDPCLRTPVNHVHGLYSHRRAWTVRTPFAKPQGVPPNFLCGST